MDINTCFETTKDYYVVSLYSHLIPVVVAILISIFTLYKSSSSLLARLFTFFSSSFVLWLIGDVFLWTSSDYDFVAFIWAPLDYINILFYLFGAYFFAVLIRERDIPIAWKLIIAILALPAWWITMENKSITVFYQPVCEAHNNEFLTNYKLFIEYIVIAFIIFYTFLVGRSKKGIELKKIVIVALAIVLFFVTFSVTEYIASISGIYEINLYGLFVLPIFLFMIVYTISDLEMFRIRFLGFEVLPYILIVMIGSQFLFLENSTYKLLTAITFALSLGFSVLLIRSGRREIESHNRVELMAVELKQANLKLQELDRQKDELLSIVSHQLAAPVTAIKWYLELLTDSNLKALDKDQIDSITSMKSIGVNLSDLVSMILDVSRIQLGKMKVDTDELDLNEFFKEILAVIEPKAAQKCIEFIKDMPQDLPKVVLDKRLTRMTIENLLTNAVKYTPEKGRVEFRITREGNMLRCMVKDTGVGIPKEEQAHAFDKLFRASNVRDTFEGNGFGLYVAKGAIEAQGGKIWFESEENKGTTFYVTLPLSNK